MGCIQISGHEAQCTPGFGTDTLQADLGDQNDSIAFSDFARANVNGGPGDDTITTGTNVCIDSLHGGSGNDTITAAGLGSCGPGDELDGDAGNDTLTAGHAWDTLSGGDGDDVLNAGGGFDVLDGGAGADILNGGDGTDTATYSDRTVGVTVTLDGAPNDGAPGEGDNVGSDIEDLLGGSGDDSLTGNGADNRIDGGGGNDVVAGGHSAWIAARWASSPARLSACSSVLTRTYATTRTTLLLSPPRRCNLRGSPLLTHRTTNAG